MMFDFSWIITVASIIGGAANSCKKRWGFAIWMVTNAFWFTYDVYHGLYSQAALYVVYFILAVVGFIRWGKLKTKQVQQKFLNTM